MVSMSRLFPPARTAASITAPNTSFERLSTLTCRAGRKHFLLKSVAYHAGTTGLQQKPAAPPRTSCQMHPARPPPPHLDPLVELISCYFLGVLGFIPHILRLH